MGVLTHTVYLSKKRCFNGGEGRFENGRKRVYILGCFFPFRHSDSKDLEDVAVIIFDSVVHTPGWDTGPDKKRTVI
jgi:hypothetical protein